jgi:hypothetical protein
MLGYVVQKQITVREKFASAVGILVWKILRQQQIRMSYRNIIRMQVVIRILICKFNVGSKLITSFVNERIVCKLLYCTGEYNEFLITQLSLCLCL